MQQLDQLEGKRQQVARPRGSALCALAIGCSWAIVPLWAAGRASREGDIQQLLGRSLGLLLGQNRS